DHAGVLTRTLKNPRGLRRKRLQQRPRVLVRAVLAPQRADDAKLGERRRAAEHVDELLVLEFGQAVFSNQGRRDCRIARTRLHLRRSRGRHARTAASIDLKTPSPCGAPMSGSKARSGCGIMPSTLPFSFWIP